MLIVNQAHKPPECPSDHRWCRGVDGKQQEISGGFLTDTTLAKEARQQTPHPSPPGASPCGSAPARCVARSPSSVFMRMNVEMFSGDFFHGCGRIFFRYWAECVCVHLSKREANVSWLWWSTNRLFKTLSLSKSSELFHLIGCIPSPKEWHWRSCSGPLVLSTSK